MFLELECLFKFCRLGKSKRKLSGIAGSWNSGVACAKCGARQYGGREPKVVRRNLGG
jgi:hypothetical protein